MDVSYCLSRCSAIRAAPETQRREDETTASDIFSAACTGVELLMGREGAFDEGGKAGRVMYEPDYGWCGHAALPHSPCDQRHVTNRLHFM